MQSRGLLGRALLEASRPDEAVVQLRKLIAFSPREPRAWYDLGQSYNAIVQASLASFNSREDEAPWRTLLLGDALAGDGRLGAAFRLYREVQDQIAGTRAVHEALVRVYEKSGHADWAATERSLSAGVTVDCGRVPAECAFAAGQHEQALDASAGRTDPASRYWRVRSATELALAAFAELERLPDSRERREMRAEFARAHGKPLDAVKEIEAALAFAPDDPVLLGGLALSYQQARDYDRAIEVARRLLIRAPNDAAMLALCGQSLLELQRIDEAVPMLERAVKLAPEPETRAALGRAYVQKGQFAAAIPLIEPALPADADGTLHFQLARAYQGAGQGEKARPLLQKYQALQQARRERDAESADTAIVAPVRR
jgi:tetratricopeptide (TPR) repeat protein